LGTLAEAWKYFGNKTDKLRRYLEQRILLHGKVFSPDELDFAGFFIRHGSFEAALRARADMVPLNPNYSGIFDEIYRHLYSAGPPVTISETEPVLMDLKQSLTWGEPVFINTTKRPGFRKIGRNEACPCGSGKNISTVVYQKHRLTTNACIRSSMNRSRLGCRMSQMRAQRQCTK
jgi:hypothetical protein